MPRRRAPQHRDSFGQFARKGEERRDPPKRGEGGRFLPRGGESTPPPRDGGTRRQRRGLAVRDLDYGEEQHGADTARARRQRRVSSHDEDTAHTASTRRQPRARGGKEHGAHTASTRRQTASTTSQTPPRRRSSLLAGLLSPLDPYRFERD